MQLKCVLVVVEAGVPWNTRAFLEHLDYKKVKKKRTGHATMFVVLQSSPTKSLPTGCSGKCKVH